MGLEDILAPGNKGEFMTNLRSSLFALLVVLGGLQTTARAEDGDTGSSGSGNEAALNEAATAQSKAQALVTRITGMLDNARREKDIMKANCLNGTLTEANALVRTLATRTNSLKAAIDSGDPGRISLEKTVVSVMGQRVDAISQQAGQCVGQDMYTSGAASTVTTQVNNSLVPTGGDNSNAVTSPPPPPATVTVAPPGAGGVLPPPVSPAM